MSMTHGTNKHSDREEASNLRPGSSHGSTSSSGSSSKHVKCIGRYVITGLLGKGNFARVEAAVHTLTRAKVAIKIIETDKIKEDYVRKNLLREAQLMRRLHHPNVIRLYETMKTNNLYCLVTEIAEGGELLSHVRNDFKEKRLTEATTRPFIRQLVSALYTLHDGGVVHRDLKMENILLDKRKKNIKIVDFGLSNIIAKPGSLLQTHCGSPEYAAPELFIPGREYGPEVDVWSLGVNMYAMLVGKLPFRSPRQGTKRRQKLLEQISAGLSEAHEAEMGHVSRNAKDLIHRLLQPDPQRRIKLLDVMVHPWVTKDGSQSLEPYKYIPPDERTRMQLTELMSTVLEVSQSEILETIWRDRCDWLAAIYNLLVDQPEGRTILQRLITDDPEDQLVDAAHYQGSMEHLRLSQADDLDRYAPEVADVLHSATANLKRSGRGYSRKALSQPQAQSENGDYDSSTLPLTKREKQRRSSHEPRPLGAPQHLMPVHPPQGYMLRRASIASPVASPEHLLKPQHHHHQLQQQHQQQIQPSHHQHHHHGHRGGSGRRILPVTPTEEPYQHHTPPHEIQRSHSRAESAPDPLPIPWRPNLVPFQLPGGSGTSSSHHHHQQHQQKSPSSEESKQPALKDALVPSPGSQHHHVHKSTMKKKVLGPLRPKSVSLGSAPAGAGNLSKSIDSLNIRHSVIPGSHTVSGIAWQQQQQYQQQQQQQKMMPSLKNKRNSEGVIHGWSSNQRLGQPADIRSLMLGSGGGMGSGAASSNAFNSIPYDMHKLDVSSANHDYGSATSVEISNEMFTHSPQSHSPHNSASPLGSSSPQQGPSPQGPSPQASNSHFRSTGDGGPSLRVDMAPGELSSQKARRRQQQSRSYSAKQVKKGQSHFPPELTTSMRHMGPPDHLHHQLYQQQKGGGDYHKEQLPNLEEKRRGSIGGLFGRALNTPKNPSLKERSSSMTLYPKQV